MGLRVSGGYRNGFWIQIVWMGIPDLLPSCTTLNNVLISLSLIYLSV